MKKYIIILIALLIFSCDEGNLVRDDRVNEKREGWVVIDSIDIGEDYTSSRLLDVVDNTFYINMVNTRGLVGEFLYKKELYQVPEHIYSSHFYMHIYENIIVRDTYFPKISIDYGENFVEIDSVFLINWLKKNQDLYLLTIDEGIIKMNTDLSSYEIIDSSFFNETKNNENIPNHNYQFFHILDNNDCMLINFTDNQILYLSDNYSKKEIIKVNNNILKDIDLHENSLLREWITIPSNNTLYILKRDGLYKSTNRGKDWSLIFDKKFHQISKLITINEELLYILDFDNDWNSTIYVSQDGGATFEIQETPKGIKIYDFKFVDDKIAYAVGNNGEILKTTSGGFKDN